MRDLSYFFMVTFRNKYFVKTNDFAYKIYNFWRNTKKKRTELVPVFDVFFNRNDFDL